MLRFVLLGALALPVAAQERREAPRDSARSIRDFTARSADAALQGRAEGVTSLEGQPGAGVSVRVVRRDGCRRPQITSGSDPLFVIDGRVLRTSFEERYEEREDGSWCERPNPLASLNPQDIERIEVVKDAAALRRFGARGANGVVLVTTKRTPLAGAAPEALALSAPSRNPAASGAAVSVRLEAPEAARVEVFDALGRRVLLVSPEASGEAVLEIPTAGLAPGVYVVRARSGAERVSRRFVVQ